MTLPPFLLERFFAKYEFEIALNLCASDMQTVAVRELVDGADDALRAQWESLELGYTESLGGKPLRDAIAEMSGVQRQDVVVFSGAQEAIYAWARSCLSATDHVVCVWPAYQSLFEVARGQGCEVSLLELRREDGWALHLSALERLLRPNTRAVIINTPHNPTGMQLPRAMLDALVALCDARGVTLLCDEVYRLLEQSEEDRLPAVVALSPHAVSIGVLSKAFGLPGLRIGWLATRDAPLLQRVAAYKDYTTICASAPSELLALMALQQRHRLLERNRALVQENRALAQRFFKEHADAVAWTAPQAGCVALAHLQDGSSADAFAERAALEHGVLVMPGSVFGRPGPEFRVGLGRLNCGEGFERLARALSAPRA